MKTFKILLLLVILTFSLQAQMFVNNDTLYGNEWIDYDQSYFKIKVVEDGFYKIDFNELNAAGIFNGSNPSGANFQLFSHGKEIPITVSQGGSLGNGDFIVFYGEKNRTELDQHLYLDPSFITNTDYSTFTDTAAYFLTWNNGVNHLRYQNTDNNLNNPPNAEAFCWREVIKSYFNKYDQGRKYNSSYNSRVAGYDLGEGFAGNFVNNQVVNISTPMVHASGPNSQINVRYRTETGAHNLMLSVNDIGQVDTTFSNPSVNEHYINLPSSSLQSSNAIRLTGENGADDKYSVGIIRIKYPHQFDFEGSSSFDFNLDASSTSKYLEITNFNANGNAPILYDLSNNLFIETTLENDLVKVVLPSSSINRRLILLNTDQYKSIIGMEQRDFVNYNNVAGNYLIISHPALMADANGNNYVQDYADYRASSMGGDFEVVVADIYDIYDQFAYGIDRHEISVRNFTHFAVKNWGLEYMFLIGKGFSNEWMRPNTNWHQYYFVPSFGAPQSDHLFATSKDSNIPLISVGRLAAVIPSQVDIYLRKVLEFESKSMLPQTIEDKAWTKRVIHLGGGDPGIQDFIKNELEDVQEIIEEGTFGAKVFPFYKTSSDVIQEAPSDQITNLINDGVSMITFFGHSAPTILDFDLDDPESYNNEGKYPLVYTIGCHTNRIFEYTSTISEKWIFAEDKGAIAFLGATWETTLSNLSAYAKYFYANLATNHYGERIGDVLRETIINFDLNGSFYAEQLKQVLILHGDPALKLNPHAGPDYLVNASSVSIEPSLINTQMDSFKLSLNVFNLGSVVQDSFLILIEHEMPNGTIIPSTELRVVSPRYEDFHQVTIPLPKEDILGFNKLHITLDALDSIPESPSPMAETNNSYQHTFYVVANDAFPVYPYEYSIVSEPNPALKAYTANAFAEFQKYYIQIDTTTYFNSPLKKESIIAQTGGVINWSPPLPFTDNTVYYWRISIDSTLTTGLGFNWHESSFLYNAGSPPGWNQSHFHQLADKNKLEFLQLEEPSRKIEFRTDVNEVKIKTGPFPIAGENDVSVILNGGLLQKYYGCSPKGLHVSVFNPDDMEPWANPPGGIYDSYNCRTFDFFSFQYKTNSVTEREYLINFLENVIPSNYYVAIYSNQSIPNGSDYYYPDWALDSLNNNLQKNIFQVLEDQGATKIRELETKGSVPYFFFYQKDNPDFLVENNYTTEVIADSLATTIEGTYLVELPKFQGALTSTIIGPAQRWNSLLWNMENYEPATDNVKLKLYGINNQNQTELLHNNIMAFDTMLNHIDAEQYPYIQLEFVSKDSTFRTSPDLDYWRVLYDPAPDAVLRPDIFLSFNSDTISQGEPLTFDMAIGNISGVDMDSLLVHYTIIDQENTPYLTETRMAPLLQGDTLMARFTFDTPNLTTPLNQLLLEVNPNNDQLEQHHFNNICILPFHVTRDIRNPLLDVTFDGVHILDGDIVSAKPLITILLQDENKHLALNDTSLFRIEIKYPDESVKKLYLSDPKLTFFPADENKLNKENKARIEIRDEFEQDGIYELSIDAQDETGNDAGEYDYKMRFEVINEEMVSNVFNYPNPFSTSTQFVFTLTGADIPDFMKIQIMTVSGKVIREITQDELGPIHVGKNITEYRWDGTDEYGDRLGNGVYLYRVVTRKLDGSLYEEYDTKTDQYFKHGIGKMVIIR